MMQGLDIVDKFIKERFTKLNNANMHGLQSMHRPLVRVSSAASSVTCPVGKVVIIALGNSSELERTSCVDCRAGSYYNRDSQTCETCQEGSFQNRTGQLSCEPCPAGKWSVGGHAKNFTECIVSSNEQFETEIAWDECEPASNH
ncbi:hypothetical protein OS493_008141 [Desmophyllum pertusum]|uniref:Tyrosine-protein kinase ephrin type A/B receptor-like domain-containing protein n=1 Tax=Desmophyllum pertusum TaxID=174260 RepID=A0A9X0A7D2_9CNID|nr:hypothetical protein OS493_008141 [Desmophyllum pertusum]